MGQLADLYKYADLAFIGAGFGAGVHSVTEAAVYTNFLVMVSDDELRAKHKTSESSWTYHILFP